MGLGDLFKKRPERFVSESAAAANAATQVAMTGETLAQLRQIGVGPERQLKLEFFFYTDTEAKSAALASQLRKLGYNVQSGLAASSTPQYLVTGWSTPVHMNEDSVAAWTREMCDIGFAHDCGFDGWGTTPEQ